MKYLSVVAFNPDLGNGFASIHPLGNVYVETGMNDKGVFIELNNGMYSDPEYVEGREETASLLATVLNQCSTVDEAASRKAFWLNATVSSRRIQRNGQGESLIRLTMQSIRDTAISSDLPTPRGFWAIWMSAADSVSAEIVLYLFSNTLLHGSDVQNCVIPAHVLASVLAESNRNRTACQPSCVDQITIPVFNGLQIDAWLIRKLTRIALGLKSRPTVRAGPRDLDYGGSFLHHLIGTILGWKEKRTAASGVNRGLGTVAFAIGILILASGGGIALLGGLAGRMGGSISLQW